MWSNARFSSISTKTFRGGAADRGWEVTCPQWRGCDDIDKWPLRRDTTRAHTGRRHATYRQLASFVGCREPDTGILMLVAGGVTTGAPCV
ncbi:hypothetical protein GCM10018954_013610 [Kutzneria kofuensis]